MENKWILKPLRWFKILDEENNTCFVIWATNHSRAKIFLNKSLWELDSDFDALSYYKASVIKEKLSREPISEWEIFERSWKDDWKELLEKWIYFSYEETCPNCWKWKNVIFANNKIVCFECNNLVNNE